MKGVLIQKAVTLLLRFLFRVSKEHFTTVKKAVEEAERKPLPGRTDDGTLSKDSWVRQEVAGVVKELAPHVFEWLLSTAVQLVKSRV